MSRPRVSLWLAAAAVWLTVPASPLRGQEPVSGTLSGEEAEVEAGAEEAATDELTPEAVAARRQRLAEEIGELEGRRSEGEEGTALEQLLDARLERLRELDQVLARQENEIARQRRIEEDLEALDALRLRGVEGVLGHGAPYTVAELDLMADRHRRAAETASILERAVAEVVEALESARDQTAEAERGRRRAREGLASNDDLAAEPFLSQQVEATQEEVRLARARQELLELEVSNTRDDLELEQSRSTLYAGFEELVRQAVAPSEDELDQALFELDESVADLQRELAEIKRATAAAQQRWASVRRRLDRADEPEVELQEEVEARRLELQALQVQSELIEDRIGFLGDSRRVARARYRNLNEALGRLEKEAEAVWLAELRGDLERAERRSDGRLLQTRAALVELEARLLSLGEASPRRRWLTAQQAHLETILALYEQDLEHQAELLLRVEVVLDELAAASPWERFQSGVLGLWNAAVAVFQFEVFVVQDQSITVGKICLTLILVLFGFLVAKRFTAFLGRRVFPRVGLHPAAAAAFQTLIFYFLVVLLALFALDLVNIPLTVFTVLGGAVALGVGFGSQNIVNNFISGLILLAERPIKVGDLVDVDGVYGKVELIGMRSTRVRSGDNTHVIVPNSAFLEKNVLNWTLSDETIRTHLDVGVAYGSPTREVAELLHKAMEGHDKILRQPKPEVLFTDFADSALTFRAYFWIRIGRVLDRIRIQSDLRYSIDSLFRDAEITIAFPQRDVHLDADKPLSVRVLPSSEG